MGILKINLPYIFLCIGVNFYCGSNLPPELKVNCGGSRNFWKTQVFTFSDPKTGGRVIEDSKIADNDHVFLLKYSKKRAAIPVRPPLDPPLVYLLRAGHLWYNTGGDMTLQLNKIKSPLHKDDLQ